jgi:hypothetical protein
MGPYLIDTNVVVDYLGGKLPLQGLNFLDNIVNQYSPMVSVITKIELLGVNVDKAETDLLKKFIESAIVFNPRSS